VGSPLEGSSCSLGSNVVFSNYRVFANGKCKGRLLENGGHGLQVVEPMEETRNQLVMVTEPVFGSVRDILNHFKNLPPALADERKDLRLSRLELKSGLLQVRRSQALCASLGCFVN
jgi:hypothetical protein